MEVSCSAASLRGPFARKRKFLKTFSKLRVLPIGIIGTVVHILASSRPLVLLLRSSFRNHREFTEQVPSRVLLWFLASSLFVATILCVGSIFGRSENVLAHSPVALAPTPFPDWGRPLKVCCLCIFPPRWWSVHRREGFVYRVAYVYV